jgi:hypothetical protein
LFLLFACCVLEANIFGFDLGRAGAWWPLSHPIFVAGRVFSSMRSSWSMAEGRGIPVAVTLLAPVAIGVPRVAFFLPISVLSLVVVVVVGLLPGVLCIKRYQCVAGEGRFGCLEDMFDVEGIAC